MIRRMTGAWTVIVCGLVMMAAARPASAPADPKKTATPTVTLTGCLQADGDKFVLKDLTGDNAPKGRSWKTLGLKKSTKDVEVAGATSSVKLKDQVGRKVSVTGTSSDETHLKAKSVKRVAASCP